MNLIPDEKCELRIIHDIRRENPALQKEWEKFRAKREKRTAEEKRILQAKTDAWHRQYYPECYGPPPSNLFDMFCLALAFFVFLSFYFSFWYLDFWVYLDCELGQDA